jgi:predicted nucleic acid-binding protein
MLKKSASFVLASLRGSTYRSVRLASSLTAALLDGLFEHPADYSGTITLLYDHSSVSHKTEFPPQLLELLAYPGLVPSEEQRIRDFLADVPITDLTQSVKHHAVSLRKRFGLKLPDAIVAATALALEATLLTNDQRLLALSDVPTQTLLVRPQSEA